MYFWEKETVFLVWRQIKILKGGKSVRQDIHSKTVLSKEVGSREGYGQSIPELEEHRSFL
jgi:hypothetical protein